MPGFDTSERERLTQALKNEANRLGFEACGVSKARRLDEDARRLEEWLLAGHHASMGWMENHFEKRVDPRRLVDGAESVVSVIHNYYQPGQRTDDPAAGKISRYAWGDDYHRVIKEKLFHLFDWLDAEAGGANGRAFVDSAPVLDKAWARESGLGWMGKHTNLISRSLGSYFFIGELIIDVPLSYDHPIEDYCGSCTRCIDACPTDAIYEPYAVDSNRCISYWTIEHRGSEIPEHIGGKMENWIFGCDICQDVCPWNKFRQPTKEPAYGPRPGLPDTSLQQWSEIDLEAFRERFRRSPVKRTKYEGFLRNVDAALNRPEPAESKA